MIRGIYTAASGMNARLYDMDVISNNIANADVSGYKSDIAIHKSFPEMLIRRFSDDGVKDFPGAGFVDQAKIVGKLGTGIEVNEVYTKHSVGSLKVTDNRLDFALDEENRFFAIQTPRGERYTRSGNFYLGKEGFIVNSQGYLLLGENGPIQVPSRDITVNNQGLIMHQQGFLTENIDSIRVVEFDEPKRLEREGHLLFRSTELSGEAQGIDDMTKSIHQGFLESSNIDVVSEMVNMIIVNRSYEANQKVVATADTLTEKMLGTFKV